jgi:hypothetical protein
MPKYEVFLDKGWPIEAPIYKFGEVFESDDPRCAEDVEHGYLAEVTTKAEAPAESHSRRSRREPPAEEPQT